MLELHVTDNDVTSGTVAVGWCVDKNTLQSLADDGIQNPMLVLVVSPEDNYDKSKEYRKVVPLKDLVAYIEFRVPGKNKIWGFISSRTKKSARNFYLEQWGSSWHNPILSVEGDEYHYVIADLPERNAQPISVDVPDGVFAPEPSEAEKAWVNHMFRYKPMDQCDFRRRRIFAYTVQPFLAVLNYAVRLFLFLIACSYGSRGLTLQPLLHPMRHDMYDVLCMLKGGTYFISNDPNHSNFRKHIGMLFMPVVLFVLYMLGSLIAALPLKLTSVLLTFVLTFVAVCTVALCVKSFIGWLVKRELNTTEPTPWYMDDEEMNLIVCSGQKKPYSFDNLPSKHKTMRLRFENLKSKVCRPFSA